MMRNILKIYNIFDLKYKKYLFFLLLIIFLTMIMETLSIGMFLPLITSVLSPEKIEQFAFVQNIYGKSFLAEIPIELFIVIFFLFIFVFRFVVLLICNWFSADFEYKIRNYITEKLYSIYIFSPFEKFYNFNSAILVKNINSEVAIYSAAIGASLILINEILVFAGILLLLLYFQPGTTIIIFIMLALFGFLINKFSKKQLNIWGKNSQKYEGQRVKHFFQTFNAIKEIKIFNKEKFFIEQSKKFNDLFFDSNKKEIFVRSLPRILLELILILGLSFFFLTIISSKKNLEELLPSVVLFGAAGYRMLPSINRILTSLQKLRFANPVIININKQLDKKINQTEINENELLSVKFTSKIKFKDVNFSYPNTTKKIFENLNIVIEKNESVGISGESGSGKSTFINLITGLINCTGGDIEIDKNKFNKIDKKEFQKRIGYVPQQTFLLDDTIGNNIAFGVNKAQYNEEKLDRILKIVELAELIKGLENGLETIVGERGAKLSGGQIQRIGIARALYINPKILVLDEATNALDMETEKKVLENINLNYKDILKIVIAHRDSSFQSCDKIYKINNRKFEIKNDK
jgi:ATP-binding cassette, subfamily B, bacterial PglK